MAGSEEYLRGLYESITDAWKFMRKWADKPEWADLIAESGEIYRKHNNSEFVKDLMIAMVGEIERRSKCMKKNE